MLFPDSRNNVGSITRQALLYIDSRYMEDITAETLAGLSGVSVQHFCRVFKAETSMRPLEYIAKRRISQAKSLLLNTDSDIGDIGKQVGYEDRNYFSIVFKSWRAFRQENTVVQEEQVCNNILSSIRIFLAYFKAKCSYLNNMQNISD